MIKGPLWSLLDHYSIWCSKCIHAVVERENARQLVLALLEYQMYYVAGLTANFSKLALYLFIGGNVYMKYVCKPSMVPYTTILVHDLMLCWYHNHDGPIYLQYAYGPFSGPKHHMVQPGAFGLHWYHNHDVAGLTAKYCRWASYPIIGDPIYI